MRVYLGVDPGITRVGIAAIDEHGAPLHVDAINDDAKVRAGRLDPSRLASITRRTQCALNQWGIFQTNFVVIGLEEPFMWSDRKRGLSNSNSLKTYGVFSVLATAFRERADNSYDENKGASLTIVSPSSWHAWIGAKDKPGVAHACKKRWGFEDKCHDIVDAFAIAQYLREAD